MPRDAATTPQAPTFGRRQSLKAASDFDRLFRQGRRSSDRLFTVIYATNTHGGPRLGFAISRHKIPKAVRRNLLRRIVRESLRALAPPLAGIDMVIIAKEPARLATNPDLFQSLARHWNRVRNADRSDRVT